MSDYGPLRTYEVTWKSGHVETLTGHQVTCGSWGLGNWPGNAGRENRFSIHGEFGGRWRLVLTAPEAELHSIRDVTGSEIIPDGTG